MNNQDIIKFFLQIAFMLACELFAGQIMRRFRQPAVLGELMGGVIIGPTILGLVLPNFYQWLFQSSPPTPKKHISKKPSHPFQPFPTQIFSSYFW